MEYAVISRIGDKKHKEKYGYTSLYQNLNTCFPKYIIKMEKQAQSLGKNIHIFYMYLCMYIHIYKMNLYNSIIR